MEYTFLSPHLVCVSLDVKWVSYRQYIYRSCFHIYSAILCLLIGAVTPLTFKVIIYFLVIQLLTPCFQCKGHRFSHWSGNYLGWNPAYHVAQPQKKQIKKDTLHCYIFIALLILFCLVKLLIPFSLFLCNLMAIFSVICGVLFFSVYIYYRFIISGYQNVYI